MRVRNKLVVLLVVTGAMGAAPAASANPLLFGLPIPVGPTIVSLPTVVNPLALTCPRDPAPFSNYYRCVVTVVPGTTIECVSGSGGSSFAADHLTGCGITSPGLTMFCGYGSATGDGIQSTSADGCNGTIGTTPVSVGCSRFQNVFVGDYITCGAGPVSYTETQGPGSTPPTQTLAIGNIKYACVNDVCQLLTS